MQNMKLEILGMAILTTILLTSCGGNNKDDHSSSASNNEIKQEAKTEQVVDPMKDKGVSPVESIYIGPLDRSLADEGHTIFKAKCTACHKIGKRFIGLDLTGLTNKQAPEWIMNMILNPEVMVKENVTAKDLLAEYMAPIANQNFSCKTL